MRASPFTPWVTIFEVPLYMELSSRVSTGHSMSWLYTWCSVVFTDSTGVWAFTFSTSPIIRRLMSTLGFRAFKSLTDMSLA